MNTNWSDKVSQPVSAKDPMRPVVSMTIGTQVEGAGRVTFDIELYRGKTPKCVENFLALCKGFPSKHKRVSGGDRKACLVNTYVSRAEPGYLLEMGNLYSEDGKLNECVFHVPFFKEENALGWRRLNCKGLVCMAHRGDGGMTSNFFIILKEGGMPSLAHRYICFGKVTEATLDDLDKYLRCADFTLVGSANAINEKNLRITGIATDDLASTAFEPRPGSSSA